MQYKKYDKLNFASLSFLTPGISTKRGLANDIIAVRSVVFINIKI
jgi:hypothetical protein